MTRALRTFATLALIALGAGMARAEPMKCSGQQQACLAICQRITNQTQAANCATVCRNRFNFCRSSGCWDNGQSRYCGLLRQ